MNRSLFACSTKIDDGDDGDGDEEEFGKDVLAAILCEGINSSRCGHNRCRSGNRTSGCLANAFTPEHTHELATRVDRSELDRKSDEEEGEECIDDAADSL